MQITEATVADHIVPLKEWDRGHGAAVMKLAGILKERLKERDLPHLGRVPDVALNPWSIDNGQALCASCHYDKTRRENWGRAQ